ncbi:MAG: hypothetical protein HY720_28970 [Planctomycetes bacterium]|nr:hypothetical protein [Planctomycetota bacterium]
MTRPGLSLLAHILLLLWAPLALPQEGGGRAGADSPEALFRDCRRLALEGDWTSLQALFDEGYFAPLDSLIDDALARIRDWERLPDLAAKAAVKGDLAIEAEELGFSSIEELASADRATARARLFAAKVGPTFEEMLGHSEFARATASESGNRATIFFRNAEFGGSAEFTLPAVRRGAKWLVAANGEEEGAARPLPATPEALYEEFVRRLETWDWAGVVDLVDEGSIEIQYGRGLAELQGEIAEWEKLPEGDAKVLREHEILIRVHDLGYRTLDEARSARALDYFLKIFREQTGPMLQATYRGARLHRVQPGESPGIATIWIRRASNDPSGWDAEVDRFVAVEKQGAWFLAFESEAEVRRRMTSYHPNEQAACETLRGIARAQEQFAESVFVDADKDGLGEYGWLQELSGEVPVRGGPPVDPALVARHLGMSSHADGGIAESEGYLFAIWLPGPEQAEREASPLAPDDPATADVRESRWACYAWPVEHGKTGSRAFFIDKSGILTATDNAATRYSGLERPPAPGAAYEPAGVSAENLDARLPEPGAPASDGNIWSRVE